MNVIQFKEANCKNCYKCIRNCPVKAITFINDQAKIIDDECVLCGNCLIVCPQNAKTLKCDIDRVKNYISRGDKVYASIAPSFIAAFEDISREKMYTALKNLGFTYMEETAIGASAVSREYQALIGQGNMKNIITSSCPTINFLIEKHYPELLDQLAPIVSPMIAHGKMLKAVYGSRIKVVFIGPCISKKEECNDLQNDGVIDAVLTFEELEKWMQQEGLTFEDSIIASGDIIRNTVSRFYPTPGGILKTLNSRGLRNYAFVSIDGIDSCIEILDTLKKGELSNYFMEMSSCKGSCLAGPYIKNTRGGILEARNRLSNYISGNLNIRNSVPANAGLSKNSSTPVLDNKNKKTDMAENNTSNLKIALTEDVKVNFHKKYIDRSKKYLIPDEATIRNILSKIRKFNKDMELNCGACGYPTCRDKAIAVYNNKANLEMCLPYMREKAESISNIVINATPNAIIALDEDLTIKEINSGAQKLLELKNGNYIGRNVYEILDCPDFEYVRESGQNLLDEKYYYEQYKITVEQSILSIPDHHLLIVILKDITADEKRKQQIYKVRAETIDMAQKVIEKQMRVAQEIASLLGETTAETKVTLTKMKKTIQTDMGDTDNIS
ncbi:MAG TPA: [Fe-Fe] hydrogenase large subunit C-terminal domain-containing protein [Clostridiales bacterium]|nr:[Fe-Fe] hydrogenase large subunit C-terminal domain-containing protein [Clostridiales bacterium]